MRDAELLNTVLLQKGYELARVEMVGIVGESGILGRRDLLRRQALGAQLRLETHAGRETLLAWRLEPVGRRIALDVAGRQRERMPVLIGTTSVHPSGESRPL